MKKWYYRAGAIFLSILLFFNVIVYNAMTVQAYALIPALKFISTIAVGYIFDKSADGFLQAVGWLPKDIRVDENGNVIISEAQMQELIDVIEDHLTDEYGTWTLTSEYKTFEEGMAALHYTDQQNYIQLRNLLDSTTYTWLSWTGQYGNAVGAPPDCYWVSPGLDSVTYFYNAQLHPVETRLACRAGLPWYTIKTTNSNTSNKTSITSSGSSTTGFCYAGPDHIVFSSTAALRIFLDEGNKMIPPTYTGGELIVTREQLQNYGVSDNTIPDGNEDSGDNNKNPDKNPGETTIPTTEMEWLELIYYRLGDILDYLKQSEQPTS